MKQITSKPLSISLLVTSIIGGVGGALLLGWVLDDLARSIFGLQEYNIPLYVIGGIVIILLGSLGTLVLVAGFFIESKPIKIITIAFSLPIPIVIEVVDLSIRFMHILNDVQVFYGVTL